MKDIFVGIIIGSIITNLIVGFINNKQPEQPCILPRNDAQMLNGYEAPQQL